MFVDVVHTECMHGYASLGVCVRLYVCAACCHTIWLPVACGMHARSHAEVVMIVSMYAHMIQCAYAALSRGICVPLHAVQQCM